MNTDEMSEADLRLFLNSNGVRDFEFINYIHPKSEELRKVGLNEQADILDDYYQKVTKQSLGWAKVFGLDELRQMAKKLQERLNAEHKS